MNVYAKTFLDLIYPPHCPGCGSLTNTLFCPKCSRLLPTIDDRICEYCGKPSAMRVNRCRECRGRRFHFDNARAVWVYRGPARQVIHDFKYKNQKYLSDELAAVLAPLAVENGIITWVPMTRRKTWNRGYNQAKLLACRLSVKTGLPAMNLLCRIRRTTDQNQLDAVGRRRNVKNAFCLSRPEKPVPNSIILVDDVYTTGATTAECSRILKKGGVASVKVITLARTLPRE